MMPTRCRRTLVFPAAVSLGFLLAAQSVAAYYDPFKPTPGEVLGRQAGDAARAMLDYKRTAAEFTAAIREARSDYWGRYPNGKGLKEAAERYGDILLNKDLYYLAEKVALRTGAGGMSFQEDPAWSSMLNMMSEGGIDGGIHLMAQEEFESWVLAVQARLRSGRSFAQALEDAAGNCQAYQAARNAAEFFMSPKSPLLSDDPKEYVTAVIWRGSFESAAPKTLTHDEARQQYKALAGLVGEDNLLKAVQSVRQAYRPTKDRYHLEVEEGSRVPPAKMIDRAIRIPGVESEIMRLLHFTIPERWVESWQESLATYKKWTSGRSPEHIKRAASLIQRAPKTTYGSTQAGEAVYRTVLLEPQRLGCQSGDNCLEQLLLMAPKDLIELEKKFETEAPQEADFVIVFTDPEYTPGAGTLFHFIGAKDAAVYIKAKGRLLEVKTDGSGHAVVNDENDWIWRTPRAVIGPDGFLYGSIPAVLQTTNHLYGSPTIRQEARHAQIFRIGTDGRNFQTLVSLDFGNDLHKMKPIADDSQLFHQLLSFFGSGMAPSVKFVDKDGTIFGTMSNNLFLFSVKRGAADFRVHYDLLKLGQRLSSIIDGGDGYLYGSAWKGTSHHYSENIFRLPKAGGAAEIIYEARGHHRWQDAYIHLVMGSDGRLYAATMFGGENNDGHIFGINTDGSGKEVIYHYPPPPAYASPFFPYIVEHSDGMLYGNTRNLDAPGGPASRLFRMGKNGEGLTLFGTDILGAMDLISHEDGVYGINAKSELYRLTPPPPPSGIGRGSAPSQASSGAAGNRRQRDDRGRSAGEPGLAPAAPAARPDARRERPRAEPVPAAQPPAAAEPDALEQQRERLRKQGFSEKDIELMLRR